MSKGYTLEEHIDIIDIAEGVALTVSADPDTSSMVNIRARGERAKRFYGDLYISMVPEAALLLAKALKTCVATVAQRMANPEAGNHVMLRKFRVYDDDSGACIEVRPHTEDFSYIQMWTPDKEGKDYWGDFELSLLPEQATVMATAIELIQQGLENG